jgi:hypothetical protein
VTLLHAVSVPRPAAMLRQAMMEQRGARSQTLQYLVWLQLAQLLEAAHGRAWALRLVTVDNAALLPTAQGLRWTLLELSGAAPLRDCLVSALGVKLRNAPPEVRASTHACIHAMHCLSCHALCSPGTACARHHRARAHAHMHA